MPATKKRTKKVRLLMADVGRCVRIQWDDIGTVDGLLVELDTPSDGKRFGRSAKVFTFQDDVLHNVELDQIVGIGKRVVPNF